MPPFASLTKSWHDRAYPAIDPARPELSCKDKIIAITGAGGAIGSEIARQFIRAGSTKIALLGRRESTINGTKAKLEEEFANTTDLHLETIRADVSDADSMRGALGNVKQNLGLIDVFVANAGYLSRFEPILEIDEDEWHKAFEVNVKGAFNSIRVLSSVAAKGCVLVDISTCPIGTEPMAEASAYLGSKAAATKIYEIFGKEQGEIEVVHVHPGVVKSEINVKSGIEAMDDVNLPGCFVVWAVSEEARFLRGKFLWCNWDVDELKAMKEKISDPNQLAIRLNGWPFGGGSNGNALKS